MGGEFRPPDAYLRHGSSAVLPSCRGNYGAGRLYCCYGRRTMLHRTVAALFAISLPATLLPFAAAAADKPVTLEARLAQPVMKHGETQKNYLRVALNGCEPKRSNDRTPVNVAFVIDRSGSMAGARIAQAREAAIMAVNRLDQNDVASVVIFDDKVDVLIPSQPVSDRSMFANGIRQIGVRGNTAIHDGVM